MRTACFWPALLTLVKLIGNTKPIRALGAGVMVMLGLFARTIHVSIDRLAFQLVHV